MTPEIATGRHRFARACFAARRLSPCEGAPLFPMPPSAAQALADLLPILVCGEESAELAFLHALPALEQDGRSQLRELLLGIAADEQRHGMALSAVRRRLPSPAEQGQARRAAHFLRHLATPVVAIHLVRIAALDIGVSCVLAEICRRGRPITAVPELATVLNTIRRDEGRHVRITRACSSALGLATEVEQAERSRTLAAFVELLEPGADAFAALGVDMACLRRRLNLAACQVRSRPTHT